MTWSFPIGRLLGSQLRIHATFPLLFLWIGYAAWSQAGQEAAQVSVILVALLFICVTAHEYGHALMARRFGIRTPTITLLPIGGMAALERMPEKPREELLVVLAGPAVNAVIFAVLWTLGGYNIPALQITTNADLAWFVGQVATLNLFLAVFNLIPAFPMDGGRLLRAMLAFRFDRVRATRIAVRVGQVAAAAMAAFALYDGDTILLLIAGFVFFTAQRELRYVELSSLAKGMTARDGLVALTDHLLVGTPVKEVRTLVRASNQEVFPVIDPETSQLVGLVSRLAIEETAREATVDDLMDAPIRSVPLDAELARILPHLTPRQPAMAVLGPQGSLAGFVTRESLDTARARNA